MQIVRNFTNHLPQPCVATIGFFDGVHAGHRFLIEQVKREAAAHGLRSALITFATHPRKVVQPQFQLELLTTLDEKLALLGELGVDICHVLDFTPDMAGLTACDFMQQVLKQACGVSRLLIGHDHRFGHNRSEGFDDYVRYGQSMAIDVVQAEAYNYHDVPVSSSVIRNYLHRGDVTMANACLCYPYFVNGEVVSGYQVGRKIGFPTANLQVNCAEKLIPADGVYAVRAMLQDGTQHKGMLNIGKRPTIDNGTERSIEVHILNFQSDLYSQPLTISFVHYMRPEMKFDSLDGLIAQLHIDAVQVTEILQ